MVVIELRYGGDPAGSLLTTTTKLPCTFASTAGTKTLGILIAFLHTFGVSRNEAKRQSYKVEALEVYWKTFFISILRLTAFRFIAGHYRGEGEE
jgi:hypothetical protein